MTNEKKMKMEVLGDGCPRCNRLFENVVAAVKGSGKEVRLAKSMDIHEIASYGVLSMPALVIDGKVKVSGKIPKVEEIKKWIK